MHHRPPSGSSKTPGRVEGSFSSSSLLLDAAVYLPAVLAIGLLATAAQAVRPGGAALGWPVLGWVTVVALLGETLGLPSWVRQTSPFELVGRVPLEVVSAAGVTGLVVGASVVTVTGHRAIVQRDLAS